MEFARSTAYEAEHRCRQLELFENTSVDNRHRELQAHMSVFTGQQYFFALFLELLRCPHTVETLQSHVQKSTILHSDPPRTIHAFLQERSLGSGGSSKVWRYLLPQRNQAPAQLALKAVYPYLQDHVQRERACLDKLWSTPHAPNPWPSPIRNGVLMECVSGTGLDNQPYRTAFHPAAVLNVTRQLAAGLQAIHNVGITHADLKSENLWCDKRGKWRYLDFGLAAMQDQADFLDPDSIVGTTQYLAPEANRRSGSCQASDVYSLGTIFFKLSTGQDFAPATDRDHFHFVRNPDSYRRLRRIQHEPLRALVEDMLHIEPGNRPSAREVHQRLLQMRADTPWSVLCALQYPLAYKPYPWNLLRRETLDTFLSLDNVLSEDCADDRYQLSGTHTFHPALLMGI